MTAIVLGDKSKMTGPYVDFYRLHVGDVEHATDDTDGAKRARALLRSFILDVASDDELTDVERRATVDLLLKQLGVE